MNPIEKQLYRKAQLWFRQYFEKDKKETKVVLGAGCQHVFQILLRLRQMSIHWSLVLKGQYTMTLSCYHNSDQGSASIRERVFLNK